MKRIKLVLILMIAVVLANSQNSFEDLMFSAQLDTIQAHNTLLVPSSGRGMGGFSYHNDTLWFDITVNGLTGPIISAHIHDGKAGVNGPVIYNLTPFINRNTIKGHLSGIILENGDLTKFLEGNYYVNVHTESNPSGEIRGQIWPETDRNYRAMLDLAQAGNPGSTASGLATINLSLDRTMLEVRLLVNGLSGTLTNAHLHYGLPGQSGPVIIPLLPFNSGNTFQGFYDLNTLTDPAGFLDSLNQGRVYVNVHTVMYPGGEIRGQVYITRTLSFDTWMTTDQETGTIDPGTPVNARGLCSLSVNSSMDTILVYAQFDQLSGAIAGSHFHEGVAGQSGPVVIDLTPFVSGNQIMAIITSTSPELGGLDISGFLEDILKRKIYVNTHTALNPAGEVRGQPDRLAREGVIYSLCPGQETGTVLGSKSAYGSGFVSMDRNSMNLHYGMAGAMFSGALTGAHFHDGFPGVSGPVIFALATDSVISGFWNDATFTPVIADKFESGGIYNNFHTILNPSGEIRGQVAKGDLCDATTDVEERGKPLPFDISVYPSPVRSNVTFSYSIPENGVVNLRVYDLLGSVVYGMEQGYQSAGRHKQSCDLSALPGGVYFYTLNLDGTKQKTEKMIVSK